MSEPTLGEIKMFAGNYAPRNFAFCNGQIMAVSQFEALFSLLGSVYGGDGRTTFGLPDLRGRIPIHYGVGPGLTNRPLGQMSGHEQNTLRTENLPIHSHNFQASTSSATSTDPQGRLFAQVSPSTSVFYDETDTPIKEMAPTAIGDSGQGTSYNNHMPSMAINFIIAMKGAYPTRN